MKKIAVSAFFIMIMLAVFSFPAYADDELAVSVTGYSNIEPGVSSTLTANVTGGYEPYTYLWSDEEESPSIIVMPDEDTEYSVKVTDVSGNTATGSFKVRVKNGLSVTIDGSGIVDEGGTVTLRAEAADGMAPYTYSWNTDPVQTGSSIEVSPTKATSYGVTVTDILGATASAHMLVKISADGKPVADADYSISLDMAGVDFGSAEEDYSTDKMEQKVRLTNAGDSSVTLKQPGSAYYQFTGVDGDTVLKAGDGVDIGILPKAELAAGDYSETIVFRTLQGTKVPLNASFTVLSPEVSENALPEFQNEDIYETKKYVYGQGAIILEIDDADEELKLGIIGTSDFVDAILTEDQKKAASEGGTITLRIRSELFSEGEVPQKEMELIDDAVSRFRTDEPLLQPGLYMDIAVSEKTDDGEWDSIEETASDITLAMQLPADFADKGRKFYLLRAHDGECKQVAVWESSDQDFRFTSNKFSLFGVAYVPVNASVSSDKAGSSGILQRAGLFLLVIVLVLVTAFLFYLKGRGKWTRKKNR